MPRATTGGMELAFYLKPQIELEELGLGQIKAGRGVAYEGNLLLEQKRRERRGAAREGCWHGRLGALHAAARLGHKARKVAAAIAAYEG